MPSCLVRFQSHRGPREAINKEYLRNSNNSSKREPPEPHPEKKLDLKVTGNFNKIFSNGPRTSIIVSGHILALDGLKIPMELLNKPTAE
jgi:hypothetical protein